MSLDLSHTVLRQVNFTKNCIGIQIGEPTGTDTFENITISKGTISQFTAAGLLVEQGSQILNFSDLIMIDSGGNGGIEVPYVFATPVSGGMIFRGTEEFPIANLFISSCKALFSNSGDQVDVNSCGLCLSFVAIAFITKSNFDDTRSLRIASGCQFSPIFDLTFVQCSFNGTTGGAGAYGIGNNGYYSVGYTLPLALQERVTISGCQAKDITATDFNAFQASGIQLEAAQNSLISKCLVQQVKNLATQVQAADLPENNPSLPTNAIGINIGHIGTKNILLNSTVDTVITSGGAAIGYNVGQSTFDCTIRKCIATNIVNNNTTEPSLATAIGYNFSLLPTAVSPDFQGAPYGSSNLCEFCNAEGVVTPSAAIEPGTGIVLFGQSKAIVKTCKMDGNGRGMIVSSDASTNPLVLTTKSYIEKNIASSSEKEGFLDTVGVAGNNTYISNIAIFNGVADTGTLNFVLPFGNPIRNWFAGAIPDSLTTDGERATNIDNISRRIG